MKDMKIKIIQMPSKRRIIEVAAIAKTSYHSEDYEHFEKILTYEEAVKFIKTLIKNGHHSVLEPLQIEFNLTGVSRVLCYDKETEILTDDGWKYFKDLIGTELVCCLDKDTHNIIFQKPLEYFEDNYVGKMYEVKSTKVDLLVTPNHRMYYYPQNSSESKKRKAQGKKDPEMWKIDHAENLYEKHIAYKKDGINVNGGLDKIIIKGFRHPHGRGFRFYEDLEFNINDFLEFLGYYISEGSLGHSNGSGYSINIAQQDESNKKKKMIDCCKRLFKTVSAYDNVIRTHDLVLYKYLERLGRAKDKHIPKNILYNLSQKQARILLNALIDGDGNRYFKNGPWSYYTISKQLADDVQVLALLSGYAGEIYIDDRIGLKRYIKKTGQKFENKNISYCVSILFGWLNPLVNHGGRKNDGFVDYNDRIYCIKTDSGILYVRRNGKPVWSGNTHEHVRNRIGFSYMQKSLRRRRIIAIEDLIYPETSKNADIYEAAMRDSIGWYELLLDRDEIPDDARRVLPIGIATELTVTCNARSLRKFLSKRLSKRASWEIRKLALRLADAVAEEELGFLIEDIMHKFDKNW
jgi:hypothetical protein